MIWGIFNDEQQEIVAGTHTGSASIPSTDDDEYHRNHRQSAGGRPKHNPAVPDPRWRPPVQAQTVVLLPSKFAAYPITVKYLFW